MLYIPFVLTQERFAGPDSRRLVGMLIPQGALQEVLEELEALSKAQQPQWPPASQPRQQFSLPYTGDLLAHLPFRGFDSSQLPVISLDD